MSSDVGIKIQRNYTIQIVRRKLLPPKPGSAEPRHTYTEVFTTRADVTSRTGASECASVDVNGKAATHTFAIRYTTIPFDIRDRLRTAEGALYQILSVEDKNLANREIRIHCATQGEETTEAAR